MTSTEGHLCELLTDISYYNITGSFDSVGDSANLTEVSTYSNETRMADVDLEVIGPSMALSVDPQIEFSSVQSLPPL